MSLAEQVITEEQAIYIRRRLIEALQLPDDFPIAFAGAPIKIAVHRDYPVSADGSQWVVPE